MVTQITLAGTTIMVSPELAERWISSGMRTGTARATAACEQWLDFCPAVLKWTPAITDDGEEYIVFAYDARIEVPVVPSGVQF